MVFQDFAIASERRRQDRERKFKKKVTIAAVSFCVAVVIIACVAFAIASQANKNNQGENKNVSKGDKKPQPKKGSTPTKQVTHVDDTIKTVCNSTTYKNKCQTSLNSAVAKNSSLSNPKDLVKAAMQAAFDEIDKAFAKASAFNFDTPQEKAAFEDCKELIDNAKEETKSSVGLAAEDKEQVMKRLPDLHNWLSAVMSYQETCIDGFLDGKLKTDMNNTFKSAKELTSNSLAMVSSLASLLSSLHSSGGSRHLLEKESDSPASENDGLPYWMSHEDRRMLKGADTDKPTPNATVAQDGSGQFKTISAALAAMPAKYEGRYVIFVKEGVYEETVTVTQKMVNVTMYGIGSQKTIVTGNKNFVDGVQTFRTAPFAVLGDGFLCKAMGFRNTAGAAKHQAVALRVQADRAIFLNCRFEGYQDTLYVQTHRQFYRSCVISGTVDFIFGDAAAIFQNCQIMVRKPMDNQNNIITAQGRVDPHETTGIVLQSCRIEPDKDLVPAKASFKSYLGRPWKLYSRTVVMESTIEDFINPDGWLPWAGDQGLNTLYYAEYKNTGPGATTDARVKWPGYHVINDSKEAEKFTVEPFLQGDWISATGATVHFGLN